VELYGQINKGVLLYDDGRETETYGLIDNANSSTRLGLRYARPLAADWTLGTRFEIQYAPYSTSNVSQENRSGGDQGFDNDNIRWIDFSLRNDRSGTVFLGQGSMATDGIAELDLSGTMVIGYSEIEDTASAQLLRYSDPDLEAGRFGPAVGDAFANFDGGRLTRVRYDTSSRRGLTASVAFGRDLLSNDPDERDLDQYDAALRYSAKLDTFELLAGVGFAGTGDDVRTWAGSASGLHRPTGLTATFAAGARDEGGASRHYWYGKLGLQRDLLAWGVGAAAIDYYAGEDINTVPTGSPTSGEITSSDSGSWGFSLVQSIDRWNTQLWLTGRRYDYSDDVARYQRGTAVFGGARFEF
jgi:hypothetical protein